MSDETSTTGTQAKREKLTGFVNWPLWSMLTRSMMIEKDVWDLISQGPREPIANPALFGKEAKENQMAIGIAQRIITEGISDQIAVNIMDLEDPKEMWERLRNICTEVGQGVVYSILQELLHYPAANKPKGYEKPVVEIFAEVRYLCKRLKAAMTKGRDPFETMAIVIALDTLHDDYDTTTASMLETGNKSIDEIFAIIQSKEAKFKSKRATGNIGDAAMTIRGKTSNSSSQKRKANSDEECYNCHQKGHFSRDCNLPDRRKRTDTPRRLESQQQAYNRSRSRNGPRANNAVEQHIDDEDDPEPFQPGHLATAFQATSLEKTSEKKTWYLDSGASRHLCNDRSLFTNLRPMSIDFVTAGKKIIRSEEIGTVSIPLADGKSIELLDIALVPECDSNLISLGQLRETGITFHDNPSHMTLIRHGVVIAQAKRHRNLFILDRAIPETMMKVRNLAMATGRGRPTHLVSKNKKVRIWHRRLGHASNARVIRASKLVDGIDIKDNEYDPTEVFIDSDTEDDDDTSGTPIVSGPTAPPELAASASETNSVFDHICGPCVGSKSTRVVIRNKSMTPTRERLEEVHADL